MSKRDYDSTLARIAGNILSATEDWRWLSDETRPNVVKKAVETARAVIEEIKRTEQFKEE